MRNAMPASIRLLLVAFFMPLLAAGCASLSPGFEEPLVEVTSIKLQNANSLSLGFEIVLRVSNPNRDALNINGMTYMLYLAGNKVISGVSNDTPSIPGYGEGEFKLQAGLSLFGGLSLLNNLMSEYQESIDYELITKLDVGRFYPKITIKRQGLFTF
jgi:LEA14-like dessication related protein